MGFFSRLFSSSDNESVTRVRQENSDTEHQRGDKYEHTSGGGHVHRSYDINTTTGEYREYGGGENSSDRSYKK